MKQYDIALVGGDARTACMLPYLLKKGYRVIHYGLSKNCETEKMSVEAKTLREAIESARYIVGGIPFFRGNTLFSQRDLPDLQKEELYHLLQKDQIVFGGVLSNELVGVCTEKEIGHYDFMKSEPLAIKNAIATAEGGILEALSHRDTNLHGSPALVLGYGRCGSVLAHKLKGLDANVRVCSQCEKELAYANTCGMRTSCLKDLQEVVAEYAYIFNTIPAQVLSRDILKKARPDVLIVDIASTPGGVDDSAAEELGIEVLHCYGLPGKYAPKAAAQDLADFVIQKLE